MIYLLMIALSIFLWLSDITYGATYHVRKDGSDAHSCSSAQTNSAANAKRTIQAGMNCLGSGDTLMIKAGTYVENDLQVRPNGGGSSSRTTVRGEGQGQTIIQGNMGPHEGAAWITIQDLTINGNQQSYITSWTGSGSNVRFQRVEITGAQHSGLLGDCTNCEFLDMDIHDNGNGPGSVCLDADLSNDLPSQCHGLYMAGSGNVIDGGSYRNNEGAGLHLYPNCTNCTLRNTRIFGNGHSGLKTKFDGGLIYNNLVYNNGSEGLRIYSGAVRIYNNTFYGMSGPAIQLDSAPTAIINNIVYGNGGTINVPSGGDVRNNLTTSPKFVNAGAGNFELQTGSAAIDKGATISLVTTDFSKTPRPQGAGFDIGAYEYTTSPASPLSTPKNFRIASQ